ncbi:transcriptional regulator with XRE-family HTH domain [Arthrobacter stackebrandtii]|uniref:Transcriptional regulator with XRE-family HTH domain n=1 Tax=Arthrobacter stackebrandtii TaxID=272161 RepID=A0ABS4YT96_9MICC|nr:helix-turn-helix transcriptional regulator [Arthrobacter stackebrandtii]MBP2411959.1 transcriptional regulator with XRE-family HTH domain [Arthrobacter stackebrandtii]PYG99828.1 transcriptional regulator [Arthrobacter stackebrandtii]
MDPRAEIRTFLTSRRAKITPAQAKLPAYGGNRRVAGLRREEVAMLAGVSVDYYTKLERGNFGSVSESVLYALARALQLTEPEREHLFHLAAGTATIKPGRRRALAQTVRPAVQRVVDGLTDAPAFVRNNSRDLLAANMMGRALYSGMYGDTAPGETPNTVRYFFFNEDARTFFRDWNKSAAEVVANLRTEVGRDPHDRALQELVAELMAGSGEFASLWADHDVRYHDTGNKELHHPVVGDLDLTFEVLDLPADVGQSLIVYGAEPGSSTEEALRLLSIWAATNEGQWAPQDPAREGLA